MTKPHITPDKPYTFGSRTIALPVQLDGLPSTIRINGKLLLKKSSFHVSLVCIGKIVEKNAIADPLFEQSIIDDFEHAIQTQDFSVVHYREEFRYVVDGEAESLIVMCDIPHLDAFFSALRETYQIPIDMQPTHVTLYTHQPDVGIFLTDERDMHQLTTLVSRPAELADYHFVTHQP